MLSDEQTNKQTSLNVAQYFFLLQKEMCRAKEKIFEIEADNTESLVSNKHK